jgi:uncharacterized membrane protein
MTLIHVEEIATPQTIPSCGALITWPEYPKQVISLLGATLAIHIITLGYPQVMLVTMMAHALGYYDAGLQTP